MESFPSTRWPQEQWSSSQQEVLATTKTSPIKAGLFGLYAQIKVDNVDLQKDLFSKKEIATREQARLLPSIALKQGTLKMPVLEPIVDGGKHHQISGLFKSHSI